MRTLLLILLTGALSAQNTVVQRDDISWTVEGQKTIGRFANGDPFIVGSFKLLSQSPAAIGGTGRHMNGSMKNMTLRDTPWGSAIQGFDSGPQFCVYDETLNMGLHYPVVMVPGDSFVTLRSDPASTNEAAKSAAVLTCLNVAPAVPSFRPPYWGPKKPTALYPLSMMDMGHLTKTFEARYATGIGQLGVDMSRLWLIPGSEWGAKDLHPKDYMPPYYRERCVKLGDVLRAVNSDVSEASKKQACIGMVQYGIDLMWAVKNGCYWDGGHGPGRKSPIVFAGLMLGHEDFLDPNAQCPTDMVNFQGRPKVHQLVWGEDYTTFFVEETAPGVYNGGFGGYTAQDVGLPEWGNFHWTDKSSDNANWETGTPYRFCCWGNSWIGEVLALRAMGGMKIWGHDAYFAYSDRYVQYCLSHGRESWNTSWSADALDAWQQYRKYDLPGVTTVGLGFPRLLVTVPPHNGQPWRIDFDTGQTGARIGLIVRAQGIARRPTTDFLGTKVDGLVFLDANTAEGAMPFAIGASGKGYVMLNSPVTNVPSTSYALQAVFLMDNGVLRTTNAVQVTVLP